MQWQPIETAPKDGDEILAWNPYGAVVASWQKWPNTAGGYWSTGCGCENDRAVKVTHWMPLPEPPNPTPRKDDR